jgi:hypothetical protein
MATDYLGIPIEVLRVRAGLAPDDATKDAQIDAAFGIALETLEIYLNRTLALGDYTETETHLAGGAISLRAYPLETVTSVQGDNGIDIAYHAEKQTGVIKLDVFVRYHEVTVDYTGGYSVLPGPLQLALLGTFDSVWASFASSGGASTIGKEIKATSIDGTRVEYNVGAVSESSGEFGVIPSNLLSMIDPYRRMFV